MNHIFISSVSLGVDKLLKPADGINYILIQSNITTNEEKVQPQDGESYIDPNKSKVK